MLFLLLIISSSANEQKQWSAPLQLSGGLFHRFHVNICLLNSCSLIRIFFSFFSISDNVNCCVRQLLRRIDVLGRSCFCPLLDYQFFSAVLLLILLFYFSLMLFPRFGMQTPRSASVFAAGVWRHCNDLTGMRCTHGFCLFDSSYLVDYYLDFLA